MTEARAIPQETVDTVADLVWEIESGLDRLISLAGELATHTTRSRLEANISATVGHKQIVAHLPGLLGGMVAARGAAVDVHNGLAVFARSRGLVTMSPPPDKTNDDGVTWEPMGRVIDLPAGRAA